ncbi:MAG: hypothetical protein Q9M23_07375, partial [Mariprofundaceae bacterium]|nr:hypothetical protein [Mariprofundaceae bacterium]
MIPYLLQAFPKQGLTVILCDMNMQTKTSGLMALVLFSLIAYLLYAWLLPADDSDQPNQAVMHSKVLQASSEPAAVPLVSKLLEQPHPVKREQPEALPPLNSRLLSPMVAGEASAVIVLLPGSSEQQYFKLGDFILPGVKLHHIDANAMVLERQGRLEAIQQESRLSLNGNQDAATDIATMMTRAR